MDHVFGKGDSNRRFTDYSSYICVWLFVDPPCQKLGMLREAERQLKSSLMDQDMVVTYLELVKVFVWAWRGQEPSSVCTRPSCSLL